MRPYFSPYLICVGNAIKWYKLQITVAYKQHQRLILKFSSLTNMFWITSFFLHENQAKQKNPENKGKAEEDKCSSNKFYHRWLINLWRLKLLFDKSVDRSLEVKQMRYTYSNLRWMTQSIAKHRTVCSKRKGTSSAWVMLSGALMEFLYVGHSTKCSVEI